MLHKSVKFIHKLRVYFLLFSSFVFLAYLGLNPLSLGRFLGAEIGLAVGMNVGVAENPFNKLALELDNKENQLNKREQELKKQEEDLSAPNKKQDRMIFLMAIGIWALFCLILFNYYLDYKRRKSIIKATKIGRENILLDIKKNFEIKQ